MTLHHINLAKRIIGTMRDERDDLRDELAELSAQNGELNNKNVELNAQLRYKDAESSILRHDLNEAYGILRRMTKA